MLTCKLRGILIIRILQADTCLCRLNMSSLVPKQHCYCPTVIEYKHLSLSTVLFYPSILSFNQPPPHLCYLSFFFFSFPLSYSLDFPSSSHFFSLLTSSNCLGQPVSALSGKYLTQTGDARGTRGYVHFNFSGGWVEFQDHLRTIADCAPRQTEQHILYIYINSSCESVTEVKTKMNK